jgi:hypothetical protein
MMRKDVRIWLFSFFADFNFSQMVHAQSLENGRKFSPITVACVIWGNNIIIPEKNLKRNIRSKWNEYNIRHFLSSD